MDQQQPVQGSYQREHFADAATEVERLAARSRLRLDGFRDLLGRHGFPIQGRLLEIGCGQGLRARLMAEWAPDAAVVGIDRDSAFIEAARQDARAAGLQNLAFLHADLHALPFAERSFDFIYARLVLINLPDARPVLQMLRRLLRPGGRILIEDADRDCMFFEPAPDSFAAYWRHIQAGQRRHGGDPNVGRRLGPLIKEAGYCDVRIEVQPIVGDGRDIAFMVRELLPSLNAYLDPSLKTLAETAVADLERLARDPRATFLHFWFAVSAGSDGAGFPLMS
ncbi:class I SAM-dependent methyltransferase [Phreatobacter sp. AB_2022a]|uniref:class I SAM-dependent methyltransferase n=1 Tax=Phreatobacter sp. AB_2022a TaxID=3003134 RepID=UPI0022872DAE|nr:class I SAM-dependent methyltransferase [Phreatobacter sp. AB_2022a]MCZ0736881.1 methyltransferase domain-containing protein [Phreatobacter sp. AB_2022a]